MNATFEIPRHPGQTIHGVGTLYAPYTPPPPPSRAFTMGVILQMAIVGISSIVLAVALIKFGQVLESLGPWGYLGVAMMEFGNSAMLVIPTPAPAYTFAMGAILNPIAIGLIGGTFSALGELIGYNIGRKGDSIVADRPAMIRLRAWTDRWGGVALFAFAALPAPFDIAGIWAGATRYPLPKFFGLVLIGKVIKVTTIALAGYFGIDLLMALWQTISE